MLSYPFFSSFFCNDTATTEIYTLSLHDALPIYYANRLPRREVLDQRKRFGDAALAFLVSVVEMFETKRFAVTEQLQEVARGIAAGDDHDVGDAGVHERLNRIIDHRPIVYRQQVFIGHCRQWAQTRSEPACQN